MNKKIIAAGHICIDITPMFPRGVRCRELGDLLIPESVQYAPVYSGAYVLDTCSVHGPVFDPSTWDPLGGTTVPEPEPEPDPLQ